VAALFLRLGATAFGGPAAHIAMLHDEVVRRRGWLDDVEFADLLAATNLIPGPNSTEMVIHVGRRVAGWRGLIIAGLAFILPSAVIVALLAVAYVEYGRAPDARAIFAGITPVVIAIILQAVVGLSRSALKSRRAWIVAATSLVLAIAGIDELLLLALGGTVMLGLRRTVSGVLAVVFATAMVTAYGTAGAPVISLAILTLFFLKVGSVLFGSGYVLVAFLEADLVHRWHWLTNQQLLDAVAIGQVTPGPVFTTATFIGYVLAGWPGAVLCTVAIFLPGFVFVALTQPLIPRLRRSPRAGAFLDGVVAASLALMLAAAMRLGAPLTADPLGLLAAAVALAALVATRINTAWAIAAGAAFGLVRAWS
jgi:chromate transporter